MKGHLHIIAFNVPYPANYGGVIDVFCKLKALSENGVKIILHAFQYGREQAEELESYCEKVYYYKRKTGVKSQLSLLPYIVYSRRSKELRANLLKDNYPILFEGLHSCYYLDDSRLEYRLKLVRLHNIEHTYYRGLAHNSKSLLTKCYMKFEAFRLQIFEKKLKCANCLLPLSTVETDYFANKYGKEKTRLIPLFHANEELDTSEQIKPYILYHGDLSTKENINTAVFLISEVASADQSISWVLGGLNPHKSIYNEAKKTPNVTIKANLDHRELQDLIREAGINILYTNQISGVKLKLINALFNGHFCLANKKMTEGSKLENLCVIVPESPIELLEKVRLYLQKQLSEDDFKKREQVLNQFYNNDINGKEIISLISKSQSFCRGKSI